MYRIDYSSYRSIKSFDHRVHFLIIHYTAINFEESIKALTGEKVSSHYLVPDPSDKSYIGAGFKDMRIFNLVDENRRAWHAGVSSWAGRTNLNDSSIGIEIVNLATAVQGDSCVSPCNEVFSPYNPIQIAAVKELALNILQRYPEILPMNVLGHSDIAPMRKSDPGPLFPWKEFYVAGVGAWYDDEVKEKYEAEFLKKLPLKSMIISQLERYGYDVSIACTESGYTDLIRAFQLHFRQKDYNGVLDAETAAILYALIDKYYPQNKTC
ncbi:N-acetylmuramoyl-L-alanine amidase [Bartonella ancashensis]|uniref:N-acetylmuramoyl-L-alanine amidase n=1 Tax=Bartonella ancashensis TaxID=1318743 RepID=A0A0M3T319_9HYPH|nr:N-acetylmuramoyl-L-alanine amidase [Bartonella ancashensis]ALE03831.1 N-acetylmuramoyl-L-alanine amidase [Bartonella ancashensis]